MDYLKFIVSNQKEESISIQRVNIWTDMCYSVGTMDIFVRTEHTCVIVSSDFLLELFVLSLIVEALRKLSVATKKIEL